MEGLANRVVAHYSALHADAERAIAQQNLVSTTLRPPITALAHLQLVIRHPVLYHGLTRQRPNKQCFGVLHFSKVDGLSDLQALRLPPLAREGAARDEKTFPTATCQRHRHLQLALGLARKASASARCASEFALKKKREWFCLLKGIAEGTY